MWSELGKFLRFFWITARWQLVLAVLLSVLLSLVEGVSLAMVFPLIAVLGDTTHPAASFGPRTQLLLHGLTLAHVPRSLWLATILTVVLVSVGLLSQLNRMLVVLTGGIVLRVRRALADDLYQAILHADWAFLTTRRSSDLTACLTSELDRTGALSSYLIQVVASALVGLLMVGVALYLSPPLTLLVLAGFAALVPWQRRVRRAIYHAGEAVSEKMAEVFDSSVERLQNLKTVKAYGAQDAELKLFTGRFHQATQEMVANQWRSNASQRHFQWMSTALLSAVILLGLGPLHLGPGSMLIFLFALMRATPRFETLQARLNDALSELPAFNTITLMLEQCARHSERIEGNAPAPTLDRQLALRSVSFSYAPEAPTVLDRVSLSLAAGRITAIAGDSGAGKSTLADLVMGLLVPTEGTIESDGVPITRANARAWRQRIGYVSQDTLLFHDTIRRNLLWARAGATEADLTAAIEAARAQFIYTLANGLDTVAGDRGTMLSHGQRQRIALARAFLLKPSLLILDEATNSLDLENEESILSTVRQLGTDVSTLLISHRPSAVRFADTVIVLEKGRVKLNGTWDEVRGIVETPALAYFTDAPSVSDASVSGEDVVMPGASGVGVGSTA